MPRDKPIDIACRPIGQVPPQLVLRARDAFAMANGRVTAGNDRLGLVVERAQQLPLPAVPRSGTDRTDIGNRQQQQQLQAFGALDDRGKVFDGLGIGNIAALGRVAHGEMLLDQPGDPVGFGRGQAEARAQPAGDRGADERMVLRAALADVVQEGGHIEDAAALDGLDDRVDSGRSVEAAPFSIS